MMNGNLQRSDLATNESDATSLLVKNLSVTTLSSGSPLLTTSSHGSTSESANSIKLSGRRWAILIALSVIGATQYVSEEQSSILHVVLELLEWSLPTLIYLSQIFTIISLALPFPVSWLIDRYGIKKIIYLNAILIFIRNSSRALLFNPDLPHWQEFKYIYWITTSSSGMITMIIYLCLPLKISETWFAASERSIAWAVMISSSYAGFIFTTATLPYIVQSVQDVKYVFYLNVVCGILAIVTSILCVTKSQPDHPPSFRMMKSNAEPIDYYKSIKAMISDRDIMLNLIFFSANDGFFSAILTVLQDVLTSVGHGESFAGLIMASASVFSLVVMNTLSFTVHRVKNILQICRIACLLSSTTLFLFLITMLYPLPDWIVLVFAIINRVVVAWANPNFSNMAAHLASGIVSEATVAGFSTFITLSALAATRIIFVAFAKETSEKLDYTYSILILALINLVVSLAYILYFGGRSSSMEQQYEAVE